MTASASTSVAIVTQAMNLRPRSQRDRVDIAGDDRSRTVPVEPSVGAEVERVEHVTPLSRRRGAHECCSMRGPMRCHSLLLSMLGAVAPAQSAPSATPLTVAGLPDGAPLTVAASHDGAQLAIVVELKKGWHLYGRETGAGEAVAVTITGGAFAATGELDAPMDDKGLITGLATLRLPLQRIGVGDALSARMRFLVCDPLECLPPIELDLATPKEALRVLLVAVDEEERTQRIAGFLQQRGLLVETTTYAKVTAARCDAVDVVLADSPTFRQVKGQTANARKFPKTASPVVAVGFLGTELIEGQQVAMTSGYI